MRYLKNNFNHPFEAWFCSSRFFSIQHKKPGFTLIELIIAMAVGLIVLGAVYGVFTIQNKSFKTQEQIVEMQQNTRVAMDMMTREIRMAGYDPTHNPRQAGIVSATANSINFTADLDENGVTTDANENITYALYTSDGIQKLGRTTGSGSAQPVADYIQSLNFTYYDSSGAVTTTIADIRKVQISITAITSKPDPDYAANGGYRTYTLTTQVILRNLSAANATTAVSTSSVTTSISSTTLTTVATTAITTTVLPSSTTTSTTSIPPEPTIHHMTQSPAGTNVARNTAVRVCANITFPSGVNTITLYTSAGDTLTMTLDSPDVYCANIPRHNNRTVSYYIVAIDNVGHTTTSLTYTYTQNL
jgi:type IV pilus assembly protein PilW